MIFNHPGFTWVSFKGSNSVCVIQRIVRLRLKWDLWKCNVLHTHTHPPGVFGLRIKGADSLKAPFEVFSSTLAQLQTVNCLDGLSEFIYKQKRVQQQKSYVITADEFFMLIFTEQCYLNQRYYESNLEGYLACSTPRPVPPAEAQKQGMADNSSL